MTLRTLATSMAAAGIVVGGLWCSAYALPRTIHATEPPVDQDTDGDFLPDRLEWVCLTAAGTDDTDADGIADFIEVVQRANPRIPGSPLPPDHEMRVVVTSDPSPTGPVVTMHLLFRFMGEVSLLSHLDAWCKVAIAPGMRFPLGSVANGPVEIHQRLVPGEGLWVRASAPLISTSLVMSLLPGTIGADATIGSKVIGTHMPLVERSGEICSLVSFGTNLVAVQTISAATAQVATTISNNRICVLQLEPVGSGSGGDAFEVVAAECQDCNDLSCGVECAGSIGSVMILPSGSGSITGG